MTFDIMYRWYNSLSGKEGQSSGQPLHDRIILTSSKVFSCKSQILFFSDIYLFHPDTNITQQLFPDRKCSTLIHYVNGDYTTWNGYELSCTICFYISLSLLLPHHLTTLRDCKWGPGRLQKEMRNNGYKQWTACEKEKGR